ncbi:MAG: hypothetical protein WC365_06810, partial [Candidatus Babeliales bacterium]
MISNPLKAIRNWLESRKTFYTLSYHGLKIKFDFNPRIKVCSVCGTNGCTNMHHTCYNFSYKEVRANPSLSLLFTYEADYSCHELSNSVRKLLFEDPSLEIKTSSKKLQIIFSNHKRLLKERDKFNQNRDV